MAPMLQGCTGPASADEPSLPARVPGPAQAVVATATGKGIGRSHVGEHAAEIIQ